MGLHYIKNGTKHDVCVKRPPLFPASATTYDNSNSGLSATRVQGAIDELVSGTVLATVTADGVKSYKELVKELVTSDKFALLTTNSKIVRDSNGLTIYNASLIASNSTHFTHIRSYPGTYGGTVDVENIYAAGENTEVFKTEIGSGATGITNLTATTPANGTIYTLYK